MSSNIFTIKNSTTKDDILSIVDNKNIDRVQISETINEDVWSLIANELLPKRPYIHIRIYGCHSGFDFNALSIISDVQVLSIDCIHISERIKGFENIKNLQKLKSISIGIYDLEDFDFLDILPDTIESISLYATKSKKPSLEKLIKFKNLKVLYLEGQQKNIDVVKNLKSLEKLTLRSISTKDLSFLEGLANLWYLDIKLGGIKNFDSLLEMNNIKYLELWSIRGLKDITFIEKMNGLQFLFLQDLTNINKMPNLLNLTNLRRVHIKNLKGLKELSGLFNSTSLEEFSHFSTTNFKPIQYKNLFKIKSLKKVSILFGSVKKNNEILEMSRNNNIEELNVYEPFIYKN